MTAKALHVLMAGVQVGWVTQDVSGRLSFAYDDAYRDGDIQIPLSLSMPLALGEHPDKAISPWMWNLLPDNEIILDRWGKKFNCSPRSAFALLREVGQDCAGAVQFLTDEMVISQTPADGTSWLDDSEIGRRLAELRDDAAAGRRRSDHGQFSLAGAQAKTAYYRDPKTGRWGVPEGRIPTTHIFKPPIPEFNGHAENEHFCLCLAQAVGLHAANSAVMEFAGEKAVVVERYDRIVEGDMVHRIHQEDMCQALKVPPGRKYEKDRGPGITRIMAEVLDRSDEPAIDRQRFMEAVIFNFLVAGTDAHAKNFSMLLDYGGAARLAPLYDVASILPHLGEGQVAAERRHIRMAMRVSDKYFMDEIMPRHWEEAARRAAFSSDTTIALLRHYIAALPDFALQTASRCGAEGLAHPVISQLVDLISSRVHGLKAIYGAEAL